MTKKTETINLKGKDYAKVSTRIKELHSKYDNASIETDYNFKDGWAICKAKVTLDVESPERFFTGHSMGKAKGDKALEKLESVSVGRALANAGFLATGEIATAEEMQKFEEESGSDGKDGDSFQKKVDQINSEAIVKRMKEVDSLDELKEVWNGLNTYAKHHEDVKQAKADMKAELSEEDMEDVVNEMES